MRALLGLLLIGCVGQPYQIGDGGGTDVDLCGPGCLDLCGVGCPATSVCCQFGAATGRVTQQCFGIGEDHPSACGGCGIECDAVSEVCRDGMCVPE